MEKNKILEAAQKENRGAEYENKESIKSNLLGSIITLIIGITLFLIEYFASGTFNIGIFSLGMTAMGVEFLYEGIKNKKSILMIFGTAGSISAIFSILAFIIKVVA